MALPQTDIDIVNGALSLLGESFITSFDDESYAARLATQLYAGERDELLTQYNWGFATTRAILAPDATAPLFGFTYRFAPPADMLRLRGLYDSWDTYNQVNYSGSRQTHKIEDGYILADDNPLYVFYIKRITDPSKFEPLFAKALQWSFALSIALPLTNSAPKMQLMAGGLKEAIRQAQLASVIQGTPEVLNASELLDARYYGNSYGPRIGPVW